MTTKLLAAIAATAIIAIVAFSVIGHKEAPVAEPVVEKVEK